MEEIHKSEVDYYRGEVLRLSGWNVIRTCLYWAVVDGHCGIVDFAASGISCTKDFVVKE